MHLLGRALPDNGEPGDGNYPQLHADTVSHGTIWCTGEKSNWSETFSFCVGQAWSVLSATHAPFPLLRNSR
jgi:hypothetical protein